MFPSTRITTTAMRPNVASSCQSTILYHIPHASFSTTSPALTTAAQQVRQRYGRLAPYPYGPRLWYKKSNFGLFGLARVRFGNNVSEEHNVKTRRRWYPNVQRRRLWSPALGRFVRVKVVARVLRSIDKVGGLDEYLLGEKAGRIRELGPGGWALRWRLMRTEAVQERYRLQRLEMGLPMRTLKGFKAVAPAGEPVGVDAGTGPEGVAIVQEEDVGLSEEELMEREAAIDRALDEDAEREKNGLDGGVELEDLTAEKPVEKKKRW